MAKTTKYTLGELEEAVMEVVWSRQEATVREVVDALQHRHIAYTTVMTVMTRLTSQRVLQRQPGEHGAFRYRARLCQDAFYTQASRAVIDDLVKRYGAVAMAQFIDRLDKVPHHQLAELRRRLANNRR